MFVCYTTDYDCKDIKRRREVKMVLQNNLKFFKKIVILWENFVMKEEYSYLNNDKFEIVNIPKRQTYKDLFIHSKENYPNDIILICNSDILFDKTINRLNELIFNNKQLYAITRWDRISKEDKSLYSPPFQSSYELNWSYDCYVFKHPLEIYPETIDIEVGVGGCDTYLVKKLIVDNLIKIENPMIDIRCWHEDYRQVENINKDYIHKINYNTKSDYPGFQNPIFKNSVTKFGGKVGLQIKNTDSFLFTKQSFLLRKGLKIISFSLFGSDEKYTKGAIKNSELALELYPDWRCWFYIDKTVPKEIVEELKNFPNVDIFVEKELFLPTTWRFKAIDDKSVDIMISRDCDSQLNKREVLAVEEWIESGKSLHIMRDHPHHCSEKGHRICAGMFGMKKVNYWPGWNNILEKYKNVPIKWGYDQDILTSEVYPLFSKYQDIHINATYNKFEYEARDFPTDYDSDYKFVGEYLFYNGERNGEHIKIIKNTPKTVSNRKKMVIDTCLVSCNYNDFYLDFWPIVYSTWKDLCGINCILILVAEEIPEKFMMYRENIILFRPEPNMSDVFQAQMLRLLYSCIMKNCQGIIVSDMDLLPMRKSFYTDIPSRYDDDRFIVFRDVIVCDGQYPICFNAGLSSTWGEIFGIQNEEDIRIKLRTWYSQINFDGRPGENGWFTDQLLLYKLVNEWNKNSGGRRILLDDEYLRFNRLDRLHIDYIQQNQEDVIDKVREGFYTDFHMPRPYSQYKNQILNLVSPLLTKESLRNLNYDVNYRTDKSDKSVKLLVLIISSDNFPIYIKLQKLWEKIFDINENITFYFLKSNPNLEEDFLIEGNTFYTKCEENWHEGITIKTIKAISELYDGYDYILRTNLSSFYIFDKLLTHLNNSPRENFFAGVQGYHEKIVFISGCGFIISKDIAKVIASTNITDILDSKYPNDDVCIAKFINEKGFKQTPLKRYDIENGNISISEIINIINSKKDLFHVRIKNIIDRENMDEKYRTELTKYYYNK